LLKTKPLDLPDTRMARWKKTLAKILTAKADHSIDFKDFESVLKGVGYTHVHTRGSHDTYKQAGWEQMHIQPKNGKAKPYQLEQFRKEFRNHGH